jgi:hypothetical protein
LTLSILYGRQQEIQDDVAIESSMLVFATRTLLSLFRQSPRLAEEAGQCSADQIRTLVKGSRGGELILLMYSDPYARMLELVDCYEERMIAEGKTDMDGRGVSAVEIVPMRYTTEGTSLTLDGHKYTLKHTTVADRKLPRCH